MHRLASLAIQAALALVAFGALTALLARPALAAVLALLAWAIVRLVDAAKRRALREPLVHSDLALFAQALRFPRLYLPYFGWGRAIALALAFAGIAWLGFSIEPAGARLPWFGAALAGALLLAAGTRIAPKVSLEPEKDVARLGLAATLWLYWREEGGLVPEPPPSWAVSRNWEGSEKPHVVAVQAESFFDPRRVGIPASLPHFDRLRAEGRSGRLGVPAWGAYTMRTEFAFLSGVPNAALGVHRFNPYRRFARRPVPTLASLLRSRGYRAVCVHPFPAAFFGRDEVFPQLGFDEFVDLRDFAGARREGPYVADLEVAAKVAQMIEAARQPMFVFAITMESHGPFWLEGADELAVYLRHLANADAMLWALAQALGAAGDGVLCAFGDHVPSLPESYAKLERQDPRTDYLLWRAGGAERIEEDLEVEALGARLLRKIGL